MTGITFPSMASGGISQAESTGHEPEANAGPAESAHEVHECPNPLWGGSLDTYLLVGGIGPECSLGTRRCPSSAVSFLHVVLAGSALYVQDAVACTPCGAVPSIGEFGVGSTCQGGRWVPESPTANALSKILSKCCLHRFMPWHSSLNSSRAANLAIHVPALGVKFRLLGLVPLLSLAPPVWPHPMAPCTISS